MMGTIRSAVSFAVILLLAGATYAQNYRTFYLQNKCNYTIWPAIFTSEVSKVKPNAPTGDCRWEATAGSLWKFQVPNNWTSGRIWGRRDCDFNSNSSGDGTDSCSTGSCIGGLECTATNGTGIPPATLAEWTLNTEDGLDYYDVSLVDGYNMPMSILTNKGCDSSDCTNDLGLTCPDDLKKGDDGCLSACAAGMGGGGDDDPVCCTGKYGTPGMCPSSGIPYYDHFKNGCPNSYIYAYDEDSGTALRKCSASLSTDYLLTFCP
ncbi:hypothetical protein ACEPAF_5274 [Sanghuangporus sanghuang]